MTATIQVTTRPGFVVAIDAGTTGVRAIAFNTDGLPVARSYREFTQYFPQPGWVEHDATEIWDVVQVVLAELNTQISGPILTIGITNQRETIVVWDARTGKPQHNAIVWQDRRTAALCAQLADDGHLALVRSTTGLVLDPYFSGTKLHWLLTTGGLDVGESTLAGTIDSWLLWNLTGGCSDVTRAQAVHATDPTNASRTLLFDIRSGEWSQPMCDLLGVPMHILPTVVPSSGRMGLTSASISVGSGIPISGIAGDQQSALFGQTCFSPGDVKNTYGTGSFILMNTGDVCPEPVEGLLTTVAWQLTANGRPGRLTYAYEGAVFVTGAAIQWLRDGLGIIDSASEIGPLAASVPSADGVVFVPALAGLGTPWWDPNARGTIVGITRGSSRAHIARATVGSIAYQVRDVVDLMARSAGFPISTMKVDGGASVMDLLCQIQADQLGVAVARPTTQETTALGAAYLAGLAEEVWTSLDELRAKWQIDARFEPDDTGREKADLDYASWKRAVSRSLNWQSAPTSSPTSSVAP